MRILTDGFVKLSNEKLQLSGKVFNSPEYASKIIEKLSGGNASVYFKAMDSTAKELVFKTFGDVYKENPEGYIIDIAEDITVYADTERAKIYAANSILGHYDCGIGKGVIYNYPCVEHRSARVFLPPHSEMPYFKKFIDTLVYHGYNAIVIELSGSMEFKRHPKINEYWAAYCKEYSEFNEKPYTHSQISKRIRNAIHTYNSNGEVYSQDEMRELSEYCNKRQLEIIPEVPSLSHSEYLLGAYPELAECKDEALPDTCCPQNEKLYEIVFELYDEVIDVFKPRKMHIGHDEWWTMCVCDECRGKDPAKLFADNVNRCYEYLAKKDVETIIWGDRLIPSDDKTGEKHGASYKKIYSTDSGKKAKFFGEEYTVYDKHWFGYPDDIEEKGGIPHEILNTEACADMINQNVKIFDWHWSLENDIHTRPLERGMWVSYGNFNGSLCKNWKNALNAGVKGISVSSWLVMDEIHTQKWCTLFEIGYSSLMAWARDYDESALEENSFIVAHDMYFFRNMEILNQHHVEITHTSGIVADNDEHGALPYIEKENIKMGEYIIKYLDGSEERYEILFNSNIGLDNLDFSRKENKVNYGYARDRRICYPIAICDYIKDNGKIWYKIAIPTSSEVKEVLCIPRSEYKNDLYVKEIVIK